MKFNITELYDIIVNMINNKKRLSRESGNSGEIVFRLDNLGNITNFGIDAIVAALKEVDSHGGYKFTEKGEVTLDGNRCFKVRYELL